MNQREDSRVTTAKMFLEQHSLDVSGAVVDVVKDLLAYGEERLKVNVGLVMENQQLRRDIQRLSQVKDD